jgi:hypothetical protein
MNPEAKPATPPAEKPVDKKEEDKRPPQQEQLLCTICHLPSCWR